MNSKYVDIPSTIQVIGNIYQNPNLLDNDKYTFIEEDFVEEFHRVLFGAIFNLHQQGASKININTIEDYLQQRPTAQAIYKTHKGEEYLKTITETTQISTFEYYYNRMKKMTLLRMYDNVGLDLSWIYDIDNILDAKKKQYQEDWFDNTSLEDMADIIDNRINQIKIKYVDNTNDNFNQAGDGIQSLILDLQQTPEYGYPMYGRLINTITRGARLKKFYLRSAATGVGKTRAMIADACNFACEEIYNTETNTWDKIGTPASTLFITTEQELDEIQTMMLAFVSGVDESHIIYNEYINGEFERVVYAGNLLKKAPLHIKVLPNFALKDIENVIKYSYHEYKVKYVCLSIY